MMAGSRTLAQDVVGRDPRAIARAISLIEGDPSLAAPEVQYLVDFIRTAAKRGVILRRPSKKADGDEE